MQGSLRAQLQQAAERLRANGDRKTAAVVGGGLSGLACAVELASRGFSVLVLDEMPAGEAAASACASLLDALSVKGRVMWRGEEAYAAARSLLDRCATLPAGESSGHEGLYLPTTILHVPSSEKQAAQYREAAAESEACSVYLGPDEAVGRVPVAHLPRGALLSLHGVVVDSAAYLRALWRLVRSLAPAEWMRQRIGSAHILAALFDVVCLAPGAGVRLIDETRHIPVDLCRGQVLEYEQPCGRGDAATTQETELCVAIAGNVYLAPLRGRVVCGATYEPTNDAEQREPPDLDAADKGLRPALSVLYPRLAPLANALGRAHTSAANVWFIGGMGARGLLYHAIVARWLVDAALGKLNSLPLEMRRVEYGCLLQSRLNKVAVADPTERSHRGWRSTVEEVDARGKKEMGDS
ncbi:hypothetical protein AB1Y20_015423 [Prymnesium parvum]|uniref:FAD dependent oxidoreductase domain-containing protein n=1 Tax=Prymnesium parvum TaxID=97485 RepID=A0AB34K1G0_PRYPA